MKSTVDVWVTRDAARTLAPPPRSIVGGDAAPVAVRTWVLGRPLQRRLEMGLVVDETTALRFSAAGKRQAIWERGVFPGAVVVLLLLVVGLETETFGARLDAVWTPLTALLLVGVLAGRAILPRLASPHHPRRDGRMVLIRDVDRQAAQDWAAVNPEGAIRLTARE
ncbi:hypothetical protein [Actinoplanes sp. NPDC051494]|uniref:hypothetical protein n=1 Tax=Actinoplanes sp. NPDC051494 TaxID=3363907 RepID=UPI0037A19805